MGAAGHRLARLHDGEICVILLVLPLHSTAAVAAIAGNRAVNTPSDSVVH